MQICLADAISFGQSRLARARHFEESTIAWIAARPSYAIGFVTTDRGDCSGHADLSR
jgi:hypothetical protein